MRQVEEGASCHCGPIDWVESSLNCGDPNFYCATQYSIDRPCLIYGERVGCLHWYLDVCTIDDGGGGGGSGGGGGGIGPGCTEYWWVYYECYDDGWCFEVYRVYAGCW